LADAIARLAVEDPSVAGRLAESLGGILHRRENNKRLDDAAHC